jgi:hypothetical protein
MAFGIDFTTNLVDRLETWRDQFVSEASWRQYARACAWTTDTVAKRVAVGMQKSAHAHLDRPTPWTIAGFTYKRALTRARDHYDEVHSEFFVKDEQSIVMKYHMGEGVHIRFPGDVGLAVDRIWIPAWENLAKSQGIRPNQYGNLSSGIMARFVRESQGDPQRHLRGCVRLAAPVIDFEVLLARAQSGTGLARPVTLELRDGRTLRIRGHFHATGVIRKAQDVEFEDSEPALIVPVHTSGGVRKDDLVFAKGSLWHVARTMVIGDGSTRLYLQDPQWIDVIAAGSGIRKVAFAGDEGDLVATAIVQAAEAWTVGQVFESTRQPGAGSFQHGREWNVATVLPWEPGYLKLGLSAVGA